MRVGVSGTFSDGFSTNVLPQAMANGYIHIGTMAGKLNGVMPAQTPSGWRMVLQSMPRATSFSESPIIRLGMPHATSTIWMARRTSIVASSTVLPFSRGKDARDFGGMLLQQRFEAIEHLHAVHHRDFAPLSETPRARRGRRGPHPPQWRRARRAISARWPDCRPDEDSPRGSSHLPFISDGTVLTSCPGSDHAACLLLECPCSAAASKRCRARRRRRIRRTRRNRRASAGRHDQSDERHRIPHPSAARAR